MMQVEDLARISFKHQPLYVGVDDQRRCVPHLSYLVPLLGCSVSVLFETGRCMDADTAFCFCNASQCDFVVR